MTVPVAAIQLQAIVEIQTADPRGKNTKRRPVVVIDLPALDDTLFTWCAVTSRVPNPIPDTLVKLPWQDQPGGHPTTGLTLECVAHCTWIQSSPKSSVLAVRGYVPQKTFRKLIDRINLLNTPGDDE